MNICCNYIDVYFIWHRLLSEHPVLLQLYKDLVIPQVLSSEEFWTMHAAQYTKDRDTVKQDIGKAQYSFYMSITAHYFMINLIFLVY